MCFELQLFRAQPAVLLRFLPSKNEESLAHDRNVCHTCRPSVVQSWGQKHCQTQHCSDYGHVFETFKHFYFFYFFKSKLDHRSTAEMLWACFLFHSYRKGSRGFFPCGPFPFQIQSDSDSDSIFTKFYKESVSKSGKLININKRQHWHTSTSIVLA